jgi:hypothetical protein
MIILPTDPPQLTIEGLGDPAGRNSRLKAWATLPAMPAGIPSAQRKGAKARRRGTAKRLSP